MQKKEAVEIRVQDFIEKIEKAGSWDFQWSRHEAKVLLMTDADETVYITPDITTISKHDFDWFTRRMEEITNAITAESEGQDAQEG